MLQATATRKIHMGSSSFGSPTGGLGDDAHLVGQRVGKLAPPQMAFPQAFHVDGGGGQVPGAGVSEVGVDQRHAVSQTIPHVAHRAGEVGVVRDHHRLLVFPVEPVDQEASWVMKSNSAVSHKQCIEIVINSGAICGQIWISGKLCMQLSFQDPFQEGSGNNKSYRTSKLFRSPGPI